MTELSINVPCQVGDKAWVIDKDENNKNTVYEAEWTRVTLVQLKRNGEFDLRGEVRYQIPDFYTGKGTMPNDMYVGQYNTKVGEVVFLNKKEAMEKLKSLE